MRWGRRSVRFARHELRCPKGDQPRDQGEWPGVKECLSAHRRPGYPSAGCSPAEPASVWPGGAKIPRKAAPNKPAR